MPPTTLRGRLGQRARVEPHLDIGRSAGRANAGDKLLTLVALALAGGDRIGDARQLRPRDTERVRGFTPTAVSTLGTFLRNFR